MRPLIGVTPDESETEPRPGRPALARYELKKAYAEAVLAAGGIPLVLPYSTDPEVLRRDLELCDGLVVTGGAFDVPPKEYGEQAAQDLGPLKPARTGFERALLELFLEAGKPVLGVCGGMQLLNVVRGGTLFQHIPDDVPDALPHEQPHDPQEPAHEVRVEAGTLLHRIVRGALSANTTHHQAVARLGRGLVASGHTSDGVIEAIEDPSARFVLGVQWHPELLADESNAAIYRAFVEACR